MMINPIATLLSNTILILGALVILFFPSQQSLNIKITDWNSDYQNQKYRGVINNDKVIIYLDTSDTDTPEETDNKKPIAGKIKIVFEDSKQKGTKLIYERDMQDGEISETDQIYIEKILSSIEKFHKENHTLNGKIKDSINNFFNNLKRKK